MALYSDVFHGELGGMGKYVSPSYAWNDPGYLALKEEIFL